MIAVVQEAGSEDLDYIYMIGLDLDLCSAF